VSKDAKQAVYWYQKAAEQGYAGAQYNLLDWLHSAIFL
jgi:TPR repeat protein